MRFGLGLLGSAVKMRPSLSIDLKCFKLDGGDPAVLREIKKNAGIYYETLFTLEDSIILWSTLFRTGST